MASISPSLVPHTTAFGHSLKAIELHPRSGVMRTREILISDLDSTIIKAYIQLLSTANATLNTKGRFKKK